MFGYQRQPMYQSHYPATPQHQFRQQSSSEGQHAMQSCHHLQHHAFAQFPHNQHPNNNAAMDIGMLPPQDLPSSDEDDFEDVSPDCLKPNLGMINGNADGEEARSSGDREIFNETLRIPQQTVTSEPLKRKRKLLEEETLCKLARVKLNDSNYSRTNKRWDYRQQYSPMKPIGNSCSYSRCSPASRQISVNVGKTRPLSCNMDSEDSDMNECPEKRMRHHGPDQTSKETSHHLVKVCLSGSDSSSSDDDETQRFVVLPKNAIWPMPSILPKKVAEEISRKSQEAETQGMAIVPYIPEKASINAMKAQNFFAQVSEYKKNFLQEDADDADDEQESAPMC